MAKKKAVKKGKTQRGHKGAKGATKTPTPKMAKFSAELGQKLNDLKAVAADMIEANLKRIGKAAGTSFDGRTIRGYIEDDIISTSDAISLLGELENI